MDENKRTNCIINTIILSIIITLLASITIMLSYIIGTFIIENNKLNVLTFFRIIIYILYGISICLLIMKCTLLKKNSDF